MFKQLSQYIQKTIVQPIIKLNEKELSIISVCFPLAYTIIYFYSLVLNLDLSLNGVFIVWYVLVSLFFPKFYPVNIFIIIISLIISGIGQITETDELIFAGSKSTFYMLMVIVAQNFILQWRFKPKPQNKDSETLAS